MLAFVCGTQERLGVESRVMVLSSALLQVVWSHVYKEFQVPEVAPEDARFLESSGDDSDF